MEALEISAQARPGDVGSLDVTLISTLSFDWSTLWQSMIIKYNAIAILRGQMVA